jgi:6,7-dimethyl-8-ribityllumazine synthase
MTMHEFKGSFDGSEKRYAIVVSRFNETYTRQLVEGAVDSLMRLGAESEDIDVYWVPGSYEVAGMAYQIAMEGAVDAIIGLGVMIRGETSHYDLVASQAAAGIAAVYKETSVPCIFAIVTAENQEQAQARCGGKMGNRGWDAAQSAVEMANLSEAFTIEEDDLSEAEEPSGEGTPDAENAESIDNLIQGKNK